ncbi:MAG TPA: hypothetical protein VF495_00020, partial [Phenylobacterium sp.]
DAPRIHEQWLPDVVYLEPYALSADTRALLEKKGHRFQDDEQWGIAEGIVTGAPRLSPPKGDGAGRALSLSQPVARGATMFGGHDVRDIAGSAAPVN